MLKFDFEEIAEKILFNSIDLEDFEMEELDSIDEFTDAIWNNKRLLKRIGEEFFDTLCNWNGDETFEKIRKEFIKELKEDQDYKLVLTIDDFMYYVDENESDENNSVIIKGKHGNLISDNYFAYAEFMKQLEKVVNGSTNYEYIDDEILEKAKAYFED